MMYTMSKFLPSLNNLISFEKLSYQLTATLNCLLRNNYPHGAVNSTYKKYKSSYLVPHPSTLATIPTGSGHGES